MAKQEFSIPALMNRLTSEHDAYLFLEELRWAGQPVCHHCGSLGKHYFLKPQTGTARKTRTGSLSQRRVWKCQDCRKQFSVLTGTIFHGTKISIRTWVLVIAEVCSAKNGISAREVERKYDLTAKTAWYMLHRIREAMKQEPFVGMLSGRIVADETWVGGELKNNRGRSRTGGKPSWARGDIKTTVLSLVDRETGEVRSRVVADVTGHSLREVIAEQVNMAASDLQTDMGKGYLPISAEFRSHRTVNHDMDEWVGEFRQTTNPAESFFSQLKRGIDGKHHRVSRQHLPRYLAQFDFMRTWCKTSDSERMRVLIFRIEGRRLPNKPLISQ
jgi:transposase-like protein